MDWVRSSLATDFVESGRVETAPGCCQRIYINCTRNQNLMRYVTVESSRSGRGIFFSSRETVETSDPVRFSKPFGKDPKMDTCLARCHAIACSFTCTDLVTSLVPTCRRGRIVAQATQAVA